MRKWRDGIQIEEASEKVVRVRIAVARQPSRAALPLHQLWSDWSGFSVEGGDGVPHPFTHAFQFVFHLSLVFRNLTNLTRYRKWVVRSLESLAFRPIAVSRSAARRAGLPEIDDSLRSREAGHPVVTMEGEERSERESGAMAGRSGKPRPKSRKSWVAQVCEARSVNSRRPQRTLTPQSSSACLCLSIFLRQRVPHRNRSDF